MRERSIIQGVVRIVDTLRPRNSEPGIVTAAGTSPAAKRGRWRRQRRQRTPTVRAVRYDRGRPVERSLAQVGKRNCPVACAPARLTGSASGSVYQCAKSAETVCVQLPPPFWHIA